MALLFPFTQFFKAFFSRGGRSQDCVSSGSMDALYTKPLIPTLPEGEEETPVKPECAICNKKIKNGRNSEFHMMSHSGVCPYCWTFSPKWFGQKNVLDQHLLTHTGQKPFACSFFWEVHLAEGF